MNAPNDLRPSANEYPVTQNGRARPFAAIDLSQHGAVSQVGVRADHRASVDIDAAEAIDEQSRSNHSIFGNRDPIRSEEHTSELQSLMRNSNSVFSVNKQTSYTQLL